MQQKLSKKIILVTSLGKIQNNYLISKLTNCTNRLFIEVIQCCSIFDIETITDCNADLIVSTVPLRIQHKAPLYICGNFLDDIDIEHILDLLTKSTTDLEHTQHISQFFHEELFFHDMEFQHEQDVIAFLCDQLKRLDYCGDDFYEKVLERERIAPTAYGNLFAIPHPVEKCAYRNAIAVCTLKHPIVWQRKKVKMIFLFSLTSGHDQAFEDIFERLVGMLNQIDNVKKLMQQRTLQAFLNVFFTMKS